VHQHHIDRQAVQPGGEGRVAAEGADLAIELQKRLLGQVFRFGHVTQHAQAQRVDPPLVQTIQALEGGSVSGLGRSDGFCLARDRRIAAQMLVGLLTLGSSGRGAFGRWGKDAVGYGFCHCYTFARQCGRHGYRVSWSPRNYFGAMPVGRR